MSSKRKWMPWALAALALAAVCAVAIGLNLRRPAQPEPGYVPPPAEQAAVPLSDWRAPQGLPTLRTNTYAFSINPEPVARADGLCGVWLSNPETNAVYLMLDVRLEESGLLIYRSGLVAPGTGLGEITLPRAALDAMQPGDNGVLLTVYSFATEGYTSMGEAPLRTTLAYRPDDSGEGEDAA